MEIRKTFEFTVRDGKKSKVFSFRQATALETLEFLEEARKPGFDPVTWLFRFLNGKCSVDRPFWNRSNVSKKEFFRYVRDVDKLFDTVKNSYFRGAFSEKSEEPAEWSPEGAYWAFIAEKLGTDPLSILERYTFEQIGELAKGISWNLQAQTEEGRKKNEIERIRRKIDRSGRDNIRDMIEKLSKK